MTDTTTGTIRLTRYQLAEAQHKGEVMRDDGASDATMAWHYGFTDETLAAFNAKLSASKGTLRLTLLEAAALYGELGNAKDIASDNAQFDDAPEYRAAVRSLKNAQAKILAVFPDARRAADLGWRRFALPA